MLVDLGTRSLWLVGAYPKWGISRLLGDMHLRYASKWEVSLGVSRRCHHANPQDSTSARPSGQLGTGPHMLYCGRGERIEEVTDPNPYLWLLFLMNLGVPECHLVCVKEGNPSNRD